MKENNTSAQYHLDGDEDEEATTEWQSPYEQ